MTFRTKRDSFFLILFSSNIFLLVIGLFVILTTFSFNPWLAWLGWILFIIAFISWITAVWFITYTLNENSILIRKGLFVKQIDYKQMVKVKEESYRLADLLSGERALSSKDGVSLDYETKIGQKIIKLSPKNKQLFIKELAKKVPELAINE
jgi:uncharacterized protein YifE (UPF0438 family)